MHTLIRFFYKFHLLFLFLILEGIAGIMLVRHNYVQRVAFINTSNSVTGNIYQYIDNWRDYLHLKELNQYLVTENIRLRNELPESLYTPDTTKNTDTGTDPYSIRKYAYLPAKVVNNTVNKQHNYITLNRGSDQGVAVDMAVVGPNGIVGIVYGVSDNFATVISVLNRDFRVSTKFKKNNLYGSLTWDGHSSRHAVLNDIDLHASVTLGDTLVVSGFSDSFPEGVPVGTVESIEQKDGSFFTITVLLATDFRSLHDVTIIEDLMKDEQDTLEHQNPNKE